MLTIGETFLRYKVISLIGSGGMGDVYLARDSQLDRKVAIKLLRKKFSENEDGLHRFILEARSASGLNHPNIITIYEIGESDGHHYIASEYIDGQTLHQRMAGGPIPLEEVLNIATQAAEAITAAHAAGIVHRDIKPENIMIRGDGYVKVLDFGLAKLTERRILSADFDADTHRMIDTSPGVVMGTVSYMSPEQARGREVDKRSDIWSLGVVLYEMVTDCLPFAGETSSDVIAAILKSEPPNLSTYAPDAPKELQRIVRKTLRKDRDDRYQHVKDLLIDLKELRQELFLRGRRDSEVDHTTLGSTIAEKTDETRAPQPATEPVKRAATSSISQMFLDQARLHPWAAISGAVIFILAMSSLAITLAKFVEWPQAAKSFQTMRLAKLTTTGNAVAGQVAISPDGKYVVYAMREDGRESLWVRQTATTGAVRIVPPGDGKFDGLTFSPDGNHVFYAAYWPDESSAVFSVPAFGGEPRKLLSDAMGPITISPDGKQVAFLRNPRTLVVAEIDGSNAKTLAEAGDGEAWWLPTWDPSRSTIAGTVFSAADSTVKIFEVRVNDGTANVLKFRPWLRISGLSWLPDGSGLLVSGRDPETQLSQIWKVSYPDGELTRITNDLSSYQGLSLSSDGNSLVSVQENRQSNIWVMGTSSGPARQLTSDIGRDEGLSGVAWSPEGSVIYTVRQTGSQDLWIMDPVSGANKQLTFGPNASYHPFVSADGRRIIFVSNRGGNADLWSMDIDGADVAQLTNSSGVEGWPSMSPDGMWIYFQLMDDKRVSTIWKMNANGGQPIQLTNVMSSRPSVSPDGRNLVCKYGEPQRVAIVSAADGTPVKILDNPEIASSSTVRWSADGLALIYLTNRRNSHEILSQPLDGGAAESLATVDDGTRIFTFDLSHRGDGIVVARGVESSDIVMLSGLR